VDAIAEAGHFVSEVGAVSTHLRVKCSVSTYERVSVMSTFRALCRASAGYTASGASSHSKKPPPYPLKGVAQTA
jgi:hypothetical protein